MRHPGGKLANGFHLLRLPELRLQVQPVGDVFDVAMHDVAGRHRMKRPAQGALFEHGGEIEHAAPRFQAVLDDFLHVVRQQLPRMVPAHGTAQLQCGVVEIGDGAVAGQLQSGIGIQLGEGGQLLQFRFNPDPLDRHGQHRGDGKQEMHLILGKRARAFGVRPEHAERLLLAGYGHGNAAHHFVVGQQR